MSRQKITAEPILKSYTEFDDGVREWTELDGQLEAVAGQQQEEIDKIKTKFEKLAGPIISRKMRLEKDFQDFGEHRKDLDFDKVRSRKLTFCTLGFRRSDELKCTKGYTWKKVLLKLKELGRGEFVKTTESVKRADIKKANLAPSDMRMFGVEIVEKDEFYFEPDKDAVAGAIKKLTLVKKIA